MSLDLNVALSMQGLHTKSGLDLILPKGEISLAAGLIFSTGAGAGQADEFFSDTRTLGPSATEDLDVAGTALQNTFGVNVALARIKFVYIRAAAANLNNLNVSRPAANGVPLFLAASDGLVLKPGGFFVWGAPDAAGVVVTAGTGDLITLTNAAGTNSVTYDVVIVGALT